MSSVQHPTAPRHGARMLRGESPLASIVSKLDVQSDVGIAHLSPNSSQDTLLFQERHQAHMHREVHPTLGLLKHYAEFTKKGAGGSQ